MWPQAVIIIVMAFLAFLLTHALKIVSTIFVSAECSRLGKLTNKELLNDSMLASQPWIECTKACQE